MATIRQWQKQKKLNNSQTAILLDIDEGWLSNWYAGRRTGMSLETIEKIYKRSGGEITSRDLLKEKIQCKNAALQGELSGKNSPKKTSKNSV